MSSHALPGGPASETKLERCWYCGIGYGNHSKGYPKAINPREMCPGDLADGLSFDELAACFASIKEVRHE